jgi:hypothetical protein
MARRDDCRQGVRHQGRRPRLPWSYPSKSSLLLLLLVMLLLLQGRPPRHPCKDGHGTLPSAGLCSCDSRSWEAEAADNDNDERRRYGREPQRCRKGGGPTTAASCGGDSNNNTSTAVGGSLVGAANPARLHNREVASDRGGDDVCGDDGAY